MQDTGFSVPEAKLDRLPTCYQTDPATGGLAIFDEPMVAGSPVLRSSRQAVGG